jgi:ribulose-phosphate 3-epimerase
MKIHPAILVTKSTDLLIQISDLLEVTKDFDIDIIDWSRTNTSSITIEEALAIKGDINFHFDLMCDHIMDKISLLVKEPRVKSIIISLDTFDDISQALDTIHHHGKRAGLSINPDKNLFEFSVYLNDIDILQIFSIEPGAQGQPFLPERLELCKQVKEMGFKGKVEVDGGVNKNTLGILKQYPIDILSIGSALSKASDPAQAFLDLKKMISD